MPWMQCRQIATKDVDRANMAQRTVLKNPLPFLRTPQPKPADNAAPVSFAVSTCELRMVQTVLPSCLRRNL